MGAQARNHEREGGTRFGVLVATTLGQGDGRLLGPNDLLACDPNRHRLQRTAPSFPRRRDSMRISDAEQRYVAQRRKHRSDHDILCVLCASARTIILPNPHPRAHMAKHAPTPHPL